MSFEVFKDRPTLRRPYNTDREAECLDMFTQLSKDPTLTAKVDIALSNVRKYAKKLGFKVKTSKIDNTSCYVWVVQSPNSKGEQKENNE